MPDDLLDYYERELGYFRKLATEFAERHPVPAGRLRIDPQRVEDPHVSRLIEAFAYLNARIRKKIDDGFPELCEGLLSVLYPEYLNPFPSCGVMDFSLHKSQFGLLGGKRIEPKSEIEAKVTDGSVCRFQTVYPITLWPFELASGDLQTPPFEVPPTHYTADAKAVVRLRLDSYSDQAPFDQMSMPKLRLFLNGDLRYIFQLYQLLMNNAAGVVFARSETDKSPVELPPGSIQPVGFSCEESLLNYSGRSRMGYHLLTEFFVFPEKFLFVDIVNIGEKILSQFENCTSLYIYIFLNDVFPNLENSISQSTFKVGSTPFVNLYDQRAEPIVVKRTDTEHRIIPDARLPLANEVHSVHRVVATSPNNEQVEFLPFYSTNHRRESNQCFWYTSRKQVELAQDFQNNGEPLGSDVYLHLVGSHGETPTEFSDWSIDVEASCFNRNYPYRLATNTRFILSAGSEMVSTDCVVRPTETIRPNFDAEAHWRLISQLSLNHLSLDGEQGAETLREILRLYNLAHDRGNDMMIDGLKDLSCRKVVGRIKGAVSSGFCKGTEITVSLDEEKFSGGGMYLFSSILEHFFGLYATINSFTKTKIQLSYEDTPIFKWPPRSGEKPMI